MKFKSKVLNFRPFLQKPIYNLLTGRFKSKIKGQGMYFEEIATYHYGDDVRNIDWKLTSKFKTPYIRRFTEEKERPLIIVIDLFSTMFFGSTEKFKSALAAEIASLVYWKTLENGDPIGACVLNDTQNEYLVPTRSTTKSLRILKEISLHCNRLNKKSIDTKNEVLAKRLKSLDYSIKNNSLVVFISDFLSFDEESKSILKNLAHRNELVGVRISDKFEREPLANTPSLVISNGDSQIFLNSNNTILNEDYARLYENEFLSISETFKRLQAPLIEVNTQEDLFNQLQQVTNG
ncbi:DUF58 domain-containing protein [Halobacteriovorax sp. DPLXC-1]|uniref:DUF58 domain-containing protein n=1 Tax=Halobacteriovorax sp. DPLXC-1 TaxID=3110771 RepID=UPI002FF39DF1